MRTFIALHTPNHWIEQLTILREELQRRNYFQGTYPQPQNLHLTIKFLGEITNETLERTNEILQTTQYPPIEATLTGLGVFTKKHVRVVWVGIEGEGITTLNERINEALQPLYPVDTKFHAHITLARVKNITQKKQLLRWIEETSIEPLTTTYKEFTLEQTTRTPTGSNYKTLHTYNLTK